MSLTPRLIEVMNYVYKIYMEKKSSGEVPTVAIRDIEQASGGKISYSTASVYLSRLVALGYLRRVGHGVYIPKPELFEKLKELGVEVESSTQG